MKAIILAAGSPRDDRTTPWVLQKLGDRAMLDYVVELARQVASADEIVVVVNAEANAIMQHLGPNYHYVVQQELRGTGHAVLQARQALTDYTGALLILYGDTALLRRSSILGLVNRHQQKQAGLTLLSALSTEPLPYGRIVRNTAGAIVDVVETKANLKPNRGVQELNVGAYVAEADVLWLALQQVIAASPHAAQHFTDVIHHLARSGHAIAGHRLLDTDELLGINTPADLEQAAFILQKRQLRPRRDEERNLIRFGTGGWRALIGEAFTLANVRRLCQALANDVLRQNREQQGVIIGYDRRFLSDSAAEVAAEVFAGNNIPVKLQRGDTPTPLLTYATAREQAAYGLMFTASHNPPQWNGLKVFATDGSLPLDEETKVIEEEANHLSADTIVRTELPIARRSGMVQDVDYTNAYVDAVEALIDLQVIRDAGLRVVLDAMHGVGQVTLDIILTEARCRIDTIHARHDPLFGGRSPAPDPKELVQLISLVQEGNYHLGLAMDGDADRIAIIDNTGAYITTNELLLLVYYYLHEVRGERGGITRNLATTHLLDRLAAHFGEKAYEVPVGFKHIAASMKAHNVLLAGESSGGLTIRGHILGKDGIFACALVVEMMARTGRTVADMLAEIYGHIGRLVGKEINLPATPEMKVIVQRKVGAGAISAIAGYPVLQTSHQDGVKFYLENDNWLLLRFSGTEPLLRIFAEADNDAKAEQLVEWAKELIAL
ncbi:MAG: NTP transferase domain-containing protein [Caldilineaceae bacterium]